MTSFIVMAILVMLLKGSILFYSVILSVSNIKITQPGEGKFFLRNTGNGKLLASDGGLVATIRPRPYTAAVWNFKSLGDNNFMLMNEMSGQTFAQAAGGDKVVQLPFWVEDLPSQYLQFLPGDGNGYFIQNAAGLVLTAEATEVTFRERDDMKWQQWQVAVVPGVVWGPVADGIGA